MQLFSLNFTVEAEDGGVTIFGKAVSDLQEDVVISGNAISGTLKAVTGYTGFSGDPALQDGNFLALKFTAPSGAIVTVELLGGYSGPVDLDADMNGVWRIENKDTQRLKVTVTKGSEVATKTYSLAGLTCL